MTLCYTMGRDIIRVYSFADVYEVGPRTLSRAAQLDFPFTFSLDLPFALILCTFFVFGSPFLLAWVAFCGPVGGGGGWLDGELAIGWDGNSGYAGGEGTSGLGGIPTLET